MTYIKTALAVQVAALFLASCSPRTGLFVAEGLEAEVNAFIEDAERLGVNLPDRRLVVGFTNENRPYAGTCNTTTFHHWWGVSETQYVVLIDRGFWDMASKDEKTVLIYHELGHCWLDRDHVEPKSIMEPFLIWDFAMYRKYYVQELFSKTERVSLKQVGQKLDIPLFEQYCDSFCSTESVNDIGGQHACGF
jgi:hypothetical protein